jgi:transcription antitermination factor NusG
LRAEPHPFLKVGRRVRIRGGAFEGLEGILVRRRGQYRVVIFVDLIQRSMAVEVDASEVAARP